MIRGERVTSLYIFVKIQYPLLEISILEKMNFRPDISVDLTEEM